MEKCFFCDKIIMPMNLMTTDEIKRFFDDNNIEFTLNYGRSINKIGNKIICLTCEDCIRNICFEKQKEFEGRLGIEEDDN